MDATCEQPVAQAFVTMPGQEDPWMTQGDPWSHGAASSWQPADPASSSHWAGVTSNAGAASSSSGYAEPAHAVEVYDSGTDTDTRSSVGDMEYTNDPELNGLTGPQVDEHLFWTYQRAKSRWRRHIRRLLAVFDATCVSPAKAKVSVVQAKANIGSHSSLP